MTTFPAHTKELLSLLNQIASFDLAEEWDNVGLLVGDPNQTISGILIGLDPTEDLLEEALAVGANTIITHHPLIFHPLKAVRTDQPTGQLIKKAIVNDIAVIGCHTNLDVVAGGVNEILAESIDLIDAQPLTGTEPVTGFGRIGNLSPPLSGEAFIEKLLKVLNIKAVSLAGRLPEEISVAAVCGGSGSDLAEAAFNKGAQVYITGEIKLSRARWAEAVNFCLIDAGHYATENLIVQALAARLKKKFTEENMPMDIYTTTRQKNPLRHIIKNNENLIYSD